MQKYKKKQKIINLWLKGRSVKRFSNPTGIQEITLTKFRKLNSKIFK